MNTARFISTATLAAVAAFASIGAQAATDFPASGEFSGATTQVSTQSTLSRAEVVAQAQQSMPTAGDNYVVTNAAQASTLTRAEVRSDAVMAVRADQIATGNFS